MIKDTYQLIGQLSAEMEKYRNWHPHFVSPQRWAMMRVELNMELTKKSIGENLKVALEGATLAMNNFAKTLKGAI